MSNELIYEFDLTAREEILEAEGPALDPVFRTKFHTAFNVFDRVDAGDVAHLELTATTDVDLTDVDTLLDDGQDWSGSTLLAARLYNAGGSDSTSGVDTGYSNSWPLAIVSGAGYIQLDTDGVWQKKYKSDAQAIDGTHKIIRVEVAAGATLQLTLVKAPD